MVSLNAHSNCVLSITYELLFVGSAALVAIIRFVKLKVVYNSAPVYSYQVQRKLVDEYCARHPTLGSRLHLPSDQEQRELLYRHLLYDDLRDIMFCFVEKIGERDGSVLMTVNAVTESWPSLHVLGIIICIVLRLLTATHPYRELSSYRSCTLTYSYVQRTLLCIGCTDMKRFMFIAAGVLPEKTASHEWVDLKYLEKGE